MDKMKVCYLCGKEKNIDEFYPRNGSKDGHRNDCIRCSSKRGSANYEKNGERIRKRRRAYGRYTRYGLTDVDISNMLKEQDGKCAICLEPIDRTAHVDHDHKCGNVRGLLCKQCNIAIGLLGDDPQRILAAVSYLMRSAGMDGIVILPVGDID